MNLLVYPLFDLRDGNLPHYVAMAELMRTSARKNLHGYDAIVELWVDSCSSFDHAFRSTFFQLLQLNREHAIVWIGADTLFVSETKIPWESDHMILWRLNNGSLDDIERGRYRFDSTMVLPARLDPNLWSLGTRLWGEGSPTGRHDREQYVFNRMYYAQHIDHAADLDERMVGFPRLDAGSWSDDTPETPDPLVIAYHAFRGPKEALGMMRRDCGRYGL